MAEIIANTGRESKKERPKIKTNAPQEYATRYGQLTYSQKAEYPTKMAGEGKIVSQ